MIVRQIALVHVPVRVLDAVVRVGVLVLEMVVIMHRVRVRVGHVGMGVLVGMNLQFGHDFSSFRVGSVPIAASPR